jgi:hypothetical protein
LKSLILHGIEKTIENWRSAITKNKKHEILEICKTWIFGRYNPSNTILGAELPERQRHIQKEQLLLRCLRPHRRACGIEQGNDERLPNRASEKH